MTIDLQAALGGFDVGFGRMTPNEDIIRTGRVPVDSYLSQGRFEREREIFKRTWLNVALDSELPKANDWIVREVEAASASVLLVRAESGEIRAFHNVCSHRSLKLVWGEKGCDRQFVCPYHAWTYSGDGSLRGIPDRAAFPHVDQARSGLMPVAVEVWRGLVFINLDPHPRQTLREFLGGVADILDEAPLDAFRYTARMTGIVNSNWKAGLDAASESYHVGVLHRDSARDMVCSVDNPFVHFLSIEFLGAHRRTSNARNPDYTLPEIRRIQKLVYESVPQVVVAEKDGNMSFDQPGINPTQAEPWGNDLFSIFPNFQMSLALNGFWTMHYWPLTVDSFRWEAHYHFQNAPRTWRERFALEGSLALYRDISSEDTACTARQQDAMKSGVRSFMQFGEYEILCRHQAAVLDAIVNRSDTAAQSIAAE
jgi:phenylpropionate dioxygenase-like ring-hydroxylating dioxygenase large terminal subunit